jgi:sec-independent protein translocase protein TatB
MFDLGWGKIVIIAVIALVVIGPKELPAVLRTVGQWMGKIRRMAAEFQGQFQEAMREAEMADLKKSIDAITDATRGIGSGFDPIASVSKDIEKSFEEKPASPPAATPTEGEPAGTAAVEAAPAGTEPPVAVEAAPPTPEPSVAAEPPVAIETPPASAPVAAAHEESGAAAPAPPPVNDAGRAA